ncbi:MAG: hypothetical protein ACYCYI_13970 [Saccharofermentanales bacterium]
MKDINDENLLWIFMGVFISLLLLSAGIFWFIDKMIGLIQKCTHGVRGGDLYNKCVSCYKIKANEIRIESEKFKSEGSEELESQRLCKIEKQQKLSA